MMNVPAPAPRRPLAGWLAPRLAGLALLVAGAPGAHAQRYEALALTGYTADVVANGTAVAVKASTTDSFDGAGNYLMENGYTNPTGEVATQGLPPGGRFTSAFLPGLPFQLASYSGANALRLPTNAAGTLTLAQPVPAFAVYVLAAAGFGPTAMDVTVTFVDGTAQVFRGQPVPDWFTNGTYAAITALGRVHSDNSFQYSPDNARLFQTGLPLDVANQGKPIAGLTVANTSGGVLNVLGVSRDVGTPGADDLVVSDGTPANPTPIPAGVYHSVTVTGSGYGVLAGTVKVAASFAVQPGGGLSDGCAAVGGPGSFTLGAGSTLGICSAAGITTSGPTGAVQVTGPRSFSPGASYAYNADNAYYGPTAQVTGTGLPPQVRVLATNHSHVTLSAPVAIAQAVDVGGGGNLVLNGQALTLLSSAAGTALAVNSGKGVVVGAATVQRYIDPALNAGLGYRHYAAPVANATVADLATAGFAPEVSQAAVYNSSATPGSTTPFPTVFGYDQSRVALANNYIPFDRGFVVPASTATPLAVGRGYAVNIAGDQLVDFNGTLNTGDLSVSLSRLAGNEDAGWQLVGNPYPAPLDYSKMAPADRAGLDAAIYVYASTGPYAGQYRSYANGVGGNPVLPVAQGFFVRVSAGPAGAPQAGGTLTFRNAQRLTAPEATNTPFQRTAADARPLVQLTLQGASGPADALYAYAQAGATPAFDREYDAEKLPNPTGLNLSSTATAGQRLAIDGRPAFDATTVLPLNVGVPAAGAYTLSATALNNLPAGLDAYLRDAQTGQTVNLRTRPAYAFTVTAAAAAAVLAGRFTLQFSATAALAAAPALVAAQVQLFPNPAHDRFAVLMPGVAGATAVQAELVNALGQAVRRQAAVLPAGGATLTIETAELAAGVYTLRLQAGNVTATKRVVLQ